MNLFEYSCESAFALSSDGTQLTVKKQSDAWWLILILLNLPAEIRYRAHNIILAFALQALRLLETLKLLSTLYFKKWLRLVKGFGHGML
jgi:hypothetical protein